MVYGLVQSLVGAIVMGRRELEQRQLRRGGTGHMGEEVATFGDGSMICNGSRLEIGLWWPFFLLGLLNHATDWVFFVFFRLGLLVISSPLRTCTRICIYSERVSLRMRNNVPNKLILFFEILI